MSINIDSNIFPGDCRSYHKTKKNFELESDHKFIGCYYYLKCSNLSLIIPLIIDIQDVLILLVFLVKLIPRVW